MLAKMARSLEQDIQTMGIKELRGDTFIPQYLRWEDTSTINQAQVSVATAKDRHQLLYLPRAK